jgi:hypothetical protein
MARWNRIPLFVGLPLGSYVASEAIVPWAAALTPFLAMGWPELGLSGEEAWRFTLGSLTVAALLWGASLAWIRKYRWRER